ncbi:hypothetical protein Hanom_Chr09g00792191 [Helianthus anomalus]
MNIIFDIKGNRGEGVPYRETRQTLITTAATQPLPAALPCLSLDKETGEGEWRWLTVGWCCARRRKGASRRGSVLRSSERRSLRVGMSSAREGGGVCAVVRGGERRCRCCGG